MSMIPLTEEQKSDFDHDGYLFVENFLNYEEVKRYVDRLVQIMNREIDKPENMLVMKDIAIAKGRVKADAGQDQVQKIQDIHNDEVFRELLQLPKILDYAENWTGPNIQSVHNMVINKPPNLDGRHPLHQDLLYFPFRPAEKIVGIWIALSDTRRENGTLAVVPGVIKAVSCMITKRLPTWKSALTWRTRVQRRSTYPNACTLRQRPGMRFFFTPC